MPPDNPTRKELLPLMVLVSEAYRLSMVNKTLGTNLTDLSSLPTDFVEAVLVWGAQKPDA